MNNFRLLRTKYERLSKIAFDYTIENIKILHQEFCRSKEMVGPIAAHIGSQLHR